MWIYLKYITIWLFFMALIVGITLLVPKLAARVDKMRRQKLEEQQTEESIPAEETAEQEK